MADNRTMEEMLQEPTQVYGDAIVETFGEAWERFKEMLRQCPHHGFLELHQINTFYNGLNEHEQDSLNATADGNLIRKTPQDALIITENKSKVRYSRNKPVAFKVSTTSSGNSSSIDAMIDKLTDTISNSVETFNKKMTNSTTVKVAEETCVICGGAHPYYDCIATDSNISSVCATKGTYNQGNIGLRHHVATNYRASPPGFPPVQKSKSLQSKQKKVTAKTEEVIIKLQFSTFKLSFRMSSRNTRRLLKQINTVKNELKCDINEHRNMMTIYFQKDTATTLVLGTLPSNTIANPRGDLKAITTLSGVSYDEPPIHLPTYSLLKELKRVPKVTKDTKLPEKLGDPGKFLIPCDFSELDECLVLADLGASINLMPLSICRKLSLPELTSTQMILELTDRLTTRTAGIAKDVFVKVGKFHFPTDFVVIDYVVYPRVPLIVERSFLRTRRALIDVYGKELTLRIDDEAIIFKVGQTSKYSYNDAESIYRIDVIDVACEEYVQEVLGFSDNSMCGSPTPTSDPIISYDDYYDTEGDIIYLEKLLNEDPSLILSSVNNKDLKQVDATMTKPSTEEPPELELKELPSHLEYTFLEGTDKIHIPIDPQDQEKTTFTCPFGTFAYQRMPFGFCNAPDTFQRCMMAIFHEMIKKTLEVFMDNFLIFGDSFSSCLSHLDKMLQRCEETNLVLNWVKCHFMVKEGIVLGHKISKSGIEVDRAKVDVIAKLPHPTSVKGVQSFLGYAGFYRRVIQDFFKIARPMTHPLEKETLLNFSKECIESFNTLKKKLIEAPISVAPDWDLPFEIMCDASDYAVGAVLGKRKTKHFQPIHYILILQEFDVIIHDKKGAENLAIDRDISSRDSWDVVPAKEEIL
nr:reverse transcriptase domain-containing protein [Tanacetum cinerariifolium]